MKESEKDLKYWKENAEEDYKQVPISVLRYITELEKVVNNCSFVSEYCRDMGYTFEEFLRYLDWKNTDF